MRLLSKSMTLNRFWRSTLIVSTGGTRMEKMVGSTMLFLTLSLRVRNLVIRMKNGQIFLFDTKGIGSDQDGVQKHNALLEYMANEENKDQHLKGGVIIFRKLDCNWCYSPLPIENTTDLSGWDAFFPDKYK